jgi:2-polyprenyl-6-methoxyphenol hydroxylase-like FAD-dependent oxidoreductase
MMYRDFKSLALAMPSDATVTTGFVNITGRKIAFDFAYPDESAWFAYLRSDAFVEVLHQRVQNIPNITLRYSARVSHLLQDGQSVTGVILSSGEQIGAKICVYCGGMAGARTLGIDSPRVWPSRLEKFQKKVKITAVITNGHSGLSEGLQNKSYEFYQRGTFDFYIMHACGKSVCCEGQFADNSPAVAEQKFLDLFSNHTVARDLLKGTDLQRVKTHAYEIDAFGVVQDIARPGLLISGAALGLDSPAYLSNCSSYYAIATGRAAGESAAECVMGNGGQAYLNSYRQKTQQCLASLKYDFEIVNGSDNQLDVFGKWINAALEYYDEYYPPLVF